MIMAENSRVVAKAFAKAAIAAALLLAPAMVLAQPAPAAVAANAPAAAADVPAATPAAPVAAVSADKQAVTPAADAYVPMKPTPGKGQPTAGAYGFQDQYSPTGKEALLMHNALLMPVITAVSLLVLGLLMYVVARFNRRANPVASKTSHNTMIEVVWTLLPVLILVVIAVPSIRLLAHQYKAPAKGAVTVKVTGYQWYWGYGYPDNGGFEVISNILSDDDAIKRGEMPQLAADNRMVVPAGEDIRIQTTGSDVIHSFSVPSLWFKLDAIPGRINERVMHIDEPGVYYGQCSELCGVRHGYMPIVVEALPRPKFEAWVKAQGGTVGAPAAAAKTAAASGTTAKPAA
ncbi:cytochrome c oxidase subunit II [Novosphingobium sp.]|uniref:cytochrome c oxidase subunit II n=1 Tax=Novosphingobium sp. TaxID=1874826 RepID=UPI003340006D